MQFMAALTLFALLGGGETCTAIRLDFPASTGALVGLQDSDELLTWRLQRTSPAPLGLGNEVVLDLYGHPAARLSPLPAGPSSVVPVPGAQVAPLLDESAPSGGPEWFSTDYRLRESKTAHREQPLRRLLTPLVAEGSPQGFVTALSDLTRGVGRELIDVVRRAGD